MNKPLTLKWALILKALLLLLFSLVLISGGLRSIIYEFTRPFMDFPWPGMGSIVAGVVVALLAVLSFITIENRQVMKWLRLVYKALRLAFKAMLLFGGWLLLIGGACVISCGGYWGNNWYLGVGAIVIGMGTIAHALPFIPATLRTILGSLWSVVLLPGGSGFFLLMLLNIGQEPITLDKLPEILLYTLLPLGMAWVGVWFLLAGYKFFSGRKNPV